MYIYLYIYICIGKNAHVTHIVGKHQQRLFSVLTHVIYNAHMTHMVGKHQQRFASLLVQVHDDILMAVLAGFVQARQTVQYNPLYK